MTKQYSNDTSDYEFDVPKRNFNNDSEGLYRAQEIVSPYPIENGRYEKKFSSPYPQRKYYKRDKDFTPEERSKILARVSEVGATRAADEFGTRRWVIMQWLDNLEKFGSIDHPKYKNKKNKNKKRGFSPQKNSEKNSEPKKISHSISDSSNEDNKILENQDKIKTEAQIPDFKDFEFNFEGLTEQESQQEPQPEKPQEKIIPARIKLKTSDDFSPEEREKILKLSDEIGVTKAALQVHAKLDVIKYWRKIRKKAAKVQKVKPADPVDPIVAENQVLKSKRLELQKEIQELTEKILNSIGDNDTRQYSQEIYYSV